jgi:hypothetical protein
MVMVDELQAFFVKRTSQNSHNWAPRSIANFPISQSVQARTFPSVAELENLPGAYRTQEFVSSSKNSPAAQLRVGAGVGIGVGRGLGCGDGTNETVGKIVGDDVGVSVGLLVGRAVG